MTATNKNSDLRFFAHKLCAFYTAALAAVKLQAPVPLQEQLAFQLGTLATVLQVNPEDITLGDESIVVTLSGTTHSFAMNEVIELSQQLVEDARLSISAN